MANLNISVTATPIPTDGQHEGLKPAHMNGKLYYPYVNSNTVITGIAPGFVVIGSRNDNTPPENGHVYWATGNTPSAWYQPPLPAEVNDQGPYWDIPSPASFGIGYYALAIQTACVNGSIYYFTLFSGAYPDGYSLVSYTITNGAPTRTHIYQYPRGSGYTFAGMCYNGNDIYSIHEVDNTYPGGLNQAFGVFQTPVNAPASTVEIGTGGFDVPLDQGPDMLGLAFMDGKIWTAAHDYTTSYRGLAYITPGDSQWSWENITDFPTTSGSYQYRADACLGVDGGGDWVWITASKPLAYTETPTGGWASRLYVKERGEAIRFVKYVGPTSGDFAQLVWAGPNGELLVRVAKIIAAGPTYERTWEYTDDAGATWTTIGTTMSELDDPMPTLWSGVGVSPAVNGMVLIAEAISASFGLGLTGDRHVFLFDTVTKTFTNTTISSDSTVMPYGGSEGMTIGIVGTGAPAYSYFVPGAYDTNVQSFQMTTGPVTNGFGSGVPVDPPTWNVGDDATGTKSETLWTTGNTDEWTTRSRYNSNTSTWSYWAEWQGGASLSYTLTANLTVLSSYANGRVVNVAVADSFSATRTTAVPTSNGATFGAAFKTNTSSLPWATQTQNGSYVYPGVYTASGTGTGFVGLRSKFGNYYFNLPYADYLARQETGDTDGTFSYSTSNTMLERGGTLGTISTGTIANGEYWEIQRTVSATTGCLAYWTGTAPAETPFPTGAQADFSVTLGSLTMTVYYQEWLPGYFVTQEQTTNDYINLAITTTHEYTNQIRAFNGTVDARVWTVPDLTWDGTTYTYTNSASFAHFIDWAYDANACYVLVQYDDAWEGNAPFAVWRFEWDGSDMSLHGQPFICNLDTLSGFANVTHLWPSAIGVGQNYVYVGGSRSSVANSYDQGNPTIVGLPVGANSYSVEWEELYIDYLSFGRVETFTGTYDSNTAYAGSYRDASASYILRTAPAPYWDTAIEVQAGSHTVGIWGRDSSAFFYETMNFLLGNNRFIHTMTEFSGYTELANGTVNIVPVGGIEYNGNVLFQIQHPDETPDLMTMGALLRANTELANVVFTNVTKRMDWGGPWIGIVDGSDIPLEPPYPGPPPSIGSISPAVIYALGEDVPVTIGGSAFDANATVTFDGVAARNVVVVTEFQITCLPPAAGISCAPDAADRTVTVVVSNNNRSSDASTSITWKPRMWAMPVNACDISDWQFGPVSVNSALANNTAEWIFNAFKISGNQHLYSTASYCWLNWDSPNGWVSQHTDYPLASLPAGMTIYAMTAVGHPTMYCYTQPVTITQTFMGQTRSTTGNGFWSTLIPADRLPGTFQWTNTANGHYFVVYGNDFSDVDLSGETIASVAASGSTMLVSSTLSPFANALAFWWSDPILVSGKAQNVLMVGHWEALDTPQPADLTP